MKGGVDEQVHVIQDEGSIDVDVDAASIALEEEINTDRAGLSLRRGGRSPAPSDRGSAVWQSRAGGVTHYENRDREQVADSSRPLAIAWARMAAS
jgi:hypothetical protein